MSLHSYSKCWLHIIWSTLNRKTFLSAKDSRKAVSKFLYEYSESKRIYMKTNYVNPEHVHLLINLPTNITIEETVKLLKGASSHWINQNNLCNSKFSWGRGYAAFSISESVLNKVLLYINNQEEHHKTKYFAEEYKSFIEAYGMKYVKDL